MPADLRKLAQPRALYDAERSVNLTKGTRIRARWIHTHPIGSFSLAGQQMKVAATEVDLTGTCRHFRGDDPANSTKILTYIEPDGDVPDSIPRTRPYGCTCPGHDLLVEVRPEWVVGVIDG